MSACRSCDAPIRWVRTMGGRQMPLDVTPSPKGYVQICLIGGEEIAVVQNSADIAAAQVYSVPLYLSHFATCPNAADHRRRPEPATQRDKPMEGRGKSVVHQDI